MNTTNQKLLNDFLESKQDIKEATKKNYMNTYQRLINILLSTKSKKSLLNITQKAVLDKINELLLDDGTTPATYNSKIDYLKLYKYLLEYNKKPISKIEKQIDKYIKINNENKAKTNQNLINDSNMTFDKLNDLLDNLSGQDYLLYFILINFSVRNQDLIIEYTNKKKLINEVLKDKINKNIIFKSKNGYIYIRNDYKTKSQYGLQKHIITDPKFISIIEDFPINEPLFKNRTGQPYKNNQISNFIKAVGNRYIKNSNLSQQLIYKIIESHYENKNDYKRLSEIAANRGHSLDVQKSSYSSI